MKAFAIVLSIVEGMVSGMRTNAYATLMSPTRAKQLSVALPSFVG